MSDGTEHPESPRAADSLAPAVAAVHQALNTSQHAEYAGLTDPAHWPAEPVVFAITAGRTFTPINEIWAVVPWTAAMTPDPAAYLRLLREAWQGRPLHRFLLVTPEALTEADVARLTQEVGVAVAVVAAPSLDLIAPPKVRRRIADIVGPFKPAEPGFDPGDAIRRHNAQLRQAIGFPQQLRQATPRAFVVPMLIAVNALVFLAMVADGVHWWEPAVPDLVRWGALHGSQVVQGEWWRLLTANYIHIGVLHIALNMWCLWAAGRFTERLFGSVAFLLAYTLSGLGGSLASVWWNPEVVGAGASGAVFGVFGAILGFMLLRRRTIPVLVLRPLMRSTLAFVGFNLYFGMTIPNIDNAAHIGGLLTGLLCGLMLSRRIPVPPGGSSRFRYLLAIPVVLILLAAGWHLSRRAASYREILRPQGSVVRPPRTGRTDATPRTPDDKALRLFKEGIAPLQQAAWGIHVGMVAIIDDATSGELPAEQALRLLGVLHTRAEANRDAVRKLKPPSPEAAQLARRLADITQEQIRVLTEALAALQAGQTDLRARFQARFIAMAAQHMAYQRELLALTPQP